MYDQGGFLFALALEKNLWAVASDWAHDSIASSGRGPVQEALLICFMEDPINIWVGINWTNSFRKAIVSEQLVSS